MSSTKRRRKNDKRFVSPTTNGIFERDGQWYIACGDKLYKINRIIPKQKRPGANND